MIYTSTLLSPGRCHAVGMMWEWAKKEGLPLPETANDITQSIDGNMPLYYWVTASGAEVRFTIDHFNMRAELELFNSNMDLKRAYVFELKMELLSITEG